MPVCRADVSQATQMHADDGRSETKPSATASGRDPQTYGIIGAAMEVHTRLGACFLESVYQEALAIEFAERRIPFAREVDVALSYRGVQLNAKFRADFVCYGEVLVELKALRALSGAEDAQVINYLKGTGLSRGLLINFGTARLEHKRIVLSSNLRTSASSADS